NRLYRSAQGLLLGGARLDTAKPPGPGRRIAIPLGDLLRECAAAGARAALHCAAERVEGVCEADRHRGCAARPVLPGGGLSSELLGAAPRPAVHRLQRFAEARGAE